MGFKYRTFCNYHIHCTYAKLLFCVYLVTLDFLATGVARVTLHLNSKSGIPTGCVAYCTGSETEKQLHTALYQDCVKRAVCSLDACMYAVTHPVKKVAQWRLRGIDAHSEEPLQCQERLGPSYLSQGQKEEMFIFYSVVSCF